MLIKKINNWTNTKWNWETIVKELNITIDFNRLNWIKNLSEFISEYSTKKWKFNWRYNSVKEKLIELKLSLSKIYVNKPDPIEYLLYLYFQEELPIRDITNRLEKLWIKYPQNSLHNLMTNVLWHSLRENSEKTEIKEKKDIAKAKNNKINTKRLEETKDAVEEILINNKAENKWFKLEDYSKKKNKTLKITYLLNKFWFIKEESRENLINFLKKFKEKWLWWDRITNALKTIINTYIIDNNNLKIEHLKIDPKLIWEIIN